MFAVKAKMYGVNYNQSSSIAFDETSSYLSAQKAPNFSVFIGHHTIFGFHWSAFHINEGSTFIEKGPKQA